MVVAVPPVSGQYIIVRRRRVVVVAQPVKQKQGGGWLIACGLVAAVVVVGKLMGGDAPSPVVKETGRRVIAASRIENGRCLAPGSVNGEPVTFEVDTGAPRGAEFPDSWARKLGLNNLHYEELWPGTRYGKIATASVDSIRVGAVVWRNVQARFYSNWAFTFGDTRPLLGLAALNAQGVHVEFDGDTCRLTVPQ
jgi:predicted aspartyl protease